MHCLTGKKPDPSAALEIADLMKLLKEEILYIGDSSHLTCISLIGAEPSKFTLIKALTVNTITNSILQSVIFVLFFIPPPPYIKLSSNNSPTTMPSMAAKIITAMVMPILMNTFFLFLSIQCSRFHYYFTGIYLSRYSSIF